MRGPYDDLTEVEEAALVLASELGGVEWRREREGRWSESTLPCPCTYPDPDPNVEDGCACGDALDEHDAAGRCRAERVEP